MSNRQNPQYRSEQQFRRVPQYDPRRQHDTRESQGRQEGNWGGYDADENYGRQRFEGGRQGEQYENSDARMSRGWDYARRDDYSGGWNDEASFRPEQTGYLPAGERGGYGQSNMQHGFHQQDRNRQDFNNRQDASQPRNERGQFTGRGPKGYKRSDERIAEDVNEALSQHGELDASEIEVKVQNGDVTLTGTVEERRFKRMAEDIAERCSGVNDVHNQIRVQSMGAEESETASQPNRSKANGGSHQKGSESRAS